MGTRSTVRIFDNDKLLVTLYCQGDGYLSGVGTDLLDFCTSRPMPFTIGRDRNVFNGMGCLAAQLIAEVKTKAGLWYIRPADAEDEDFNYEIHGGWDFETGAPWALKFKVDSYGKKFEGDADEFRALILNPPEDDE